MFDAAWLEIPDFALRINKTYPVYSAMHAGESPF